MNYRWWVQGFNGGIYETGEPVNGDDVLSTFTEARDALAIFFSTQARNYEAARYRARKLRKRDMERGGIQCLS